MADQLAVLSSVWLPILLSWSSLLSPVSVAEAVLQGLLSPAVPGASVKVLLATGLLHPVTF